MKLPKTVPLSLKEELGNSVNRSPYLRPYRKNWAMKLSKARTSVPKRKTGQSMKLPKAVPRPLKEELGDEVSDPQTHDERVEEDCAEYKRALCVVYVQVQVAGKDEDVDQTSTRTYPPENTNVVGDCYCKIYELEPF